MVVRMKEGEKDEEKEEEEEKEREEEERKEDKPLTGEVVGALFHSCSPLDWEGTTGLSGQDIRSGGASRELQCRLDGHWEPETR